MGNSRRFVAAFVLLVSSLAPLPALAGQEWPVVQAFIAMGAQIASAFVSAATSIIFAMKQSTSDVRGDMSVQMGVERSATEAALAYKAERYMKEKAINETISARMDDASNQCYSVEEAAALETSSKRQSVNLAALKMENGFSGMGYGEGNKAYQIARILREHEPYCSGLDADRGRCSAADLENRNADISVTSLHAQNGLMTLAPSELVTAKQYARLVTNPFPSPAKPNGISEKTPAGRRLVAEQLINQAGMSLATDAFASDIALRMGR